MKNKRKIIILLIISVLLIIFLPSILREVIGSKKFDEKKLIKQLAKEHGLKNVIIVKISEKNRYCNIYAIKCRNYSSYSYDEMLEIHDDLTRYSYTYEIEKYICGRNIYECNSDSRIVILNGKEVYNDYYCSRDFKNKLKQAKEENEPKELKVGLSEGYISKTKYGPYSKKTGGYVGSWNHRKNYAYEYYWYDKNDKLILKVHTYNGEVDYYIIDGVTYE